jgi:hypothetical protein
MVNPRIVALLPLLCVVLAAAPPIGAQGRGSFPPRDARVQATGTAIIRGRIVTADTGSPIRRAQVRAFSNDTRGSRLASTDGDGRFEFRDLPAGRWELSASKAGFVTLRFGQRRPFEAGQPVEVRDGQVAERTNIALPRGGAITGRVFDEFGDAIAGARLQVLRYQMVQGTRRLMPTGIADQSDDTGAFRLFGLTPGDYYVSATVRALPVDDPGVEAAGYAPTYYPGTGNVAEAQRVTIGIAQELANVSFALLPVRTVRVSGRAVNSMGEPLSGGIARLTPADATSDTPMMFGGGGNVRQDGTFTLTNIAPGSYTLTVATRRPGRRGGRGAETEGTSEDEIAVIPLTVGTEDVGGVQVATSKGATLSGTVVAAQGSGIALPTSGIQVTAQAIPLGRGFGFGSARVESNGAFTLGGLLGPRVIGVTGLPQNWMLQSITVNGDDVADRIVEFTGNQELRGARVTVTDRVTEVNGSVTDGNQPARDYTVVVFPEDSARWKFPSRYVKSGRPDQKGLFRIRALPPEDRYLAVAVDYVEEGEAGDPEFLEQIRAGATRFALGDGETRMLELKLVQR